MFSFLFFKKGGINFLKLDYIRQQILLNITDIKPNLNADYLSVNKALLNIYSCFEFEIRIVW